MSASVGESPTCSVPALLGCDGLWPYDYGHALVQAMSALVGENPTWSVPAL